MVNSVFVDAKKAIKKQAFLATILLVIIVFVIGILIGKTSVNSELTQVEQFMKTNELATESYAIEQTLMENFEKDCSFAQTRLTTLSEKLWRMGKILSADTAEQDLGKANYDYLKTKFHLMQIRVYVLYKQLKEQCHTNTTIILFYYKSNENNSEMQGKILDQIVNDTDARVLAVEYGYSKEINFLEEFYSISKVPTIIVNFETKKEGLVSYEDIAKIITETKD